MRILFLEDDANRIKTARQGFIGHRLTVAETAQEAIQALTKEDHFDMVSLDHDLGGKQMCDSDENSGYAVAEFIATMEDALWPSIVIVHSFNPAGADRMVKCLRRCDGLRIIRATFGSAAYWQTFYAAGDGSR